MVLRRDMHHPAGDRQAHFAKIVERVFSLFNAVAVQSELDPLIWCSVGDEEEHEDVDDVLV